MYCRCIVGITTTRQGSPLCILLHPLPAHPCYQKPTSPSPLAQAYLPTPYTTTPLPPPPLQPPDNWNRTSPRSTLTQRHLSALNVITF